jgi:DNA-binding MarR family transcriptional regulator
MDNELLQTGLRIINRYNSISNQARTYGTDVLLHPAEIHLIDAIGLEGNVTTTMLANKLGITKGGISQTTAKLMKKGLIEKSEGDGINEVYLSLTALGKKAYRGHKKLHEPLNKKMLEISESMDLKTKRKLEEMFAVIEDELSRLEKK